MSTMNLSIACPKLAGRVAYFLPNWEVLTQDQWVLQTVAGYYLELTEAPVQNRVPHQIRCSPEGKSQITSGALVQRGSGGDTSLTKELCVPDLPGGKEGWGSETSDKLEGSQPICEGRTLQDGRSSLAPRPPTVTGLDGKDGFEGCLPSSAHPSRLSTPSHLPVGGENLQVSMPTFWPISSTQSVYKAVEASSGLPETEWVSSDHLSRRSADDASEQSSAGANYPTDLLTVREPGVNGESEKIHTDPYSGVGISRFSVVLNDNENITPLREAPQDSAGCQTNDAASICLGEGNRTICGESNCHHEGHPTSPFALPSSSDADELSPSPELQSGGNFKQIQHSALTDLSQQGRSAMVANKHNSSNGGTSAIDNCTFRCVQSGLGSSAEWPIPDRGCMVSRGGNSSHKLPRVAGCLLGNQGFWEDLAEHHSLAALGQCHSSELHNQKGGTVSRALCELAISIWTWCTERNITIEAEHLPGQLNSQADQESRTIRDRCDWKLKQQVFHQIQTAMGPLEVDLFASRLTKQLPRFYSWRPDPEAEATDAFMQDWATCRGFANPPWCLIHRCLAKVRRQTARIVLITPLWKTQSWFPLVLDLLEDYPRRIPQQQDLVSMPLGQEFLMQQGIPQLIAWPISGNPTHHEEFLLRLQTSCSDHGETKPIPTMVPHFLDGLAGVNRGIRIPLQDL